MSTDAGEPSGASSSGLRRRATIVTGVLVLMAMPLIALLPPRHEDFHDGNVLRVQVVRASSAVASSSSSGSNGKPAVRRQLPREFECSNCTRVVCVSDLHDLFNASYTGLIDMPPGACHLPWAPHPGPRVGGWGGGGRRGGEGGKGPMGQPTLWF